MWDIIAVIVIFSVYIYVEFTCVLYFKVKAHDELAKYRKSLYTDTLGSNINSMLFSIKHFSNFSSSVFHMRLNLYWKFTTWIYRTQEHLDSNVITCSNKKALQSKASLLANMGTICSGYLSDDDVEQWTHIPRCNGTRPLNPPPQPPVNRQTKPKHYLP